MGSGFDGAVLCGGASRRMGRDKALIELEGRAMAERVADALTAAGAQTVAFVGGAPRPVTEGRHVPDRWPGEGPLGGVITALDAVGETDLVAVLACDLLDPAPAVIASLVEELRRAGTDAAFAAAGGVTQWTYGVWRRPAVGRLETEFAAGTRSLHSAVAALSVARIVVAPAMTADADTPDDLPDGAV